MIYPEGTVDESAFFQGAQAGLTLGTVVQCPYRSRTVAGKSWREGFRQGRELLEMTTGSALHAVVETPESQQNRSE